MSEDAPAPATSAEPAPVVVVTGLSGAGRTTAINALEDLGYEALNNFPLSLVEALLTESARQAPPLALGVETRTRGFSANGLRSALTLLRRHHDRRVLLLFLDCDTQILVHRFNATRRRHPLSPAEDAPTGIARERDILREIRAEADILIDTSQMSPHDLRREVGARFALEAGRALTVTINSFSYKRGTPAGADMVLDLRFLRNPYWEPALRDLDGRDAAVEAFVTADPRFEAFFGKLCELLLLLLPAYVGEGKVYFSVALGCTGGRHRSVSVAERLQARLGNAGWAASLRHRELERSSVGQPAKEGGKRP